MKPRAAPGVRVSLSSRAMRLLARREHSRVELRTKLLRYVDDVDDPGKVEQLLDRLQEQGLLSDARFAAGLVRQRSPRYGNARLALELRSRGVRAEEAGVALATLPADETERAHRVWSHRFDALPRDHREYARQGSFLQRRGFSVDAIRAVLTGQVGAREDA